MKFFAKSSYEILLFFGALVLVWWVFFGFSWLLFVLFLALCFLCRNTQRAVFCTDDKAIIAPVCGRITSISAVKHGDLGECVQLVIENALYNEGIIRASSKMRIMKVKVRHGLFGFDMANFCERVLILAKNGDTNFGLRISGGSLERKIGLYEGLGELEAGEELGFSLNATLSLLLPKDTRLLVGIGDEIASCALLGYFSTAQNGGAQSQISAKNSAQKAKISKQSTAKNLNQSTQISQTKSAKTDKNSTTKQSKNSTSPKTNSAKTKTLNPKAKIPKNSKSTKAALKSTTKTSAKAKNSAQSSANSSKGAR